MPLAVDDRNTEPSSESAAITTTPAISPSPGATGWSGHQPPAAAVISSAAR